MRFLRLRTRNGHVGGQAADLHDLHLRLSFGAIRQGRARGVLRRDRAAQGHDPPHLFAARPSRTGLPRKAARRDGRVRGRGGLCQRHGRAHRDRAGLHAPGRHDDPRPPDLWRRGHAVQPVPRRIRDRRRSLSRRDRRGRSPPRGRGGHGPRPAQADRCRNPGQPDRSNRRSGTDGPPGRRDRHAPGTSPAGGGR